MSADPTNTASAFAPLALNTTDAGRYIGVEPKTMSNWRSLGIGPPFARVGGRVVYRVADLDQWIAERMVGGGHHG